MRGQLHGECMGLPKHIFTASGSGCLIYPPSRHGENRESIESPREVAAQTTGGNGMPLYNGSSKGIKVLDVSSMDIIFRGKVWNHMEDPCAKSVVHLLERNESLVTWLQPKGGSVQDQIPAINVNGQYRSLSLRMQKSIWRHIRLKKGFINLENLSQVCPPHACVGFFQIVFITLQTQKDSIPDDNSKSQLQFQTSILIPFFWFKSLQWRCMHTRN
jgi:hypothetical protein